MVWFNLIWLSLVWFDGVPTTVGYLMPNPLYTYMWCIQSYEMTDQFL